MRAAHRTLNDNNARAVVPVKGPLIKTKRAKLFNCTRPAVDSHYCFRTAFIAETTPCRRARVMFAQHHVLCIYIYVCTPYVYNCKSYSTGPDDRSIHAHENRAFRVDGKQLIEQKLVVFVARRFCCRGALRRRCCALAPPYVRRVHVACTRAHTRPPQSRVFGFYCGCVWHCES